MMSPWEALTSTMKTSDPFWRAVVLRLGTMPMPCPFAVRDLAAEEGVDPEKVYIRFLAHFHEAPWWWKQ